MFKLKFYAKLYKNYEYYNNYLKKYSILMNIY